MALFPPMRFGILLLLLAAPAVAHETNASLPLEPVGWSFELPVVLPLLLSALLYGFGTFRLWRRAGTGRGIRRREAAAFVVGWLVLAGALVSPLHALSTRLFTAHMIEHELLMAVAAPFIVLAHPLTALLWGLPQSWRSGLGRFAQTPLFARVWSWLSRPLVATILHGVAIWVWHAPVLFREALRHEWVHWLQHLSFVVTGLLFWWALLSRLPARSAQGIGHLFATSVHTSLLGALLVFSTRTWFEIQSVDAAAWGLTPLEDQQLAGLIMWVPGGMIYFAAALALAGMLLSPNARGSR
jgi:cytochrome c oxidase assembly factor CtaG